MKHESETWFQYIPTAVGRALLSFCGIFIIPKTGWRVGLIEVAIAWALFFVAIMIIATYNSH